MRQSHAPGPRKKDLRTFLRTSRALSTLRYPGLRLLWAAGSLLYAVTLFSTAPAFDSPARQAILLALVPRGLVTNAIVGNSVGNQGPPREPERH